MKVHQGCPVQSTINVLSGKWKVQAVWRLSYGALRFAELFGRPAPPFSGEEAPTALLSNAQRAYSLFGYPAVPLERMLRWVAHWVMQGGVSWGKATHFEVRDGDF